MLASSFVDLLLDSMMDSMVDFIIVDSVVEGTFSLFLRGCCCHYLTIRITILPICFNSVLLQKQKFDICSVVQFCRPGGASGYANIDMEVRRRQKDLNHLQVRLYC